MPTAGETQQIKEAYLVFVLLIEGGAMMRPPVDVWTFAVVPAWQGSALVIPKNTARHFALLEGVEGGVDLVQSIGAADELIEFKLLG